MDHIDEHDEGAFLQFEINKYIDCEKLVKCLIYFDEEYIKNNITDEKALKNYELVKSISTKRISDMMTAAYLNSYLDSVYEFDTTKSFLEQIPERIKDLQKNCIKLIGSGKIIGVDIETEEAETLIPEEMVAEVFKEMEAAKANITEEMMEQCKMELEQQ
jgi:hypothetical protein